MERYEHQLGVTASALPAILNGPAAGAPPPAAGEWVLEECVVNNTAYLWDRATGRLYSYALNGQWPRPVGFRASGGTGAPRVPHA